MHLNICLYSLVQLILIDSIFITYNFCASIFYMRIASFRGLAYDSIHSIFSYAYVYCVRYSDIKCKVPQTALRYPSSVLPLKKICSFFFNIIIFFYSFDLTSKNYKNRNLTPSMIKSIVFRMFDLLDHLRGFLLAFHMETTK